MLAFTKSLKGKLAVYFAVSIVISLLISGLISVGLVQRYLRNSTVSDLEVQAQSIAAQIEDEGELPNQAYQRDLERVQGVRMLLVDTSGVVSQAPVGPGRGGPLEPALFHINFLDWQALADGETLVVEAVLPGADKETVVVADAYSLDGELQGAVVLAKPLNLLQPWRPIAGEFLVAALIALAMSLALAFLLARHLSRPLHEITQAAAAVAEGDFSHEVTVRSEDEIGRLADSFRHMTAEVQKSQEQQREFVINVSHELKTPLTAITGHTQALREGVAHEPEEVERSLEVISTETARLRRLIEDLISLAKFDTRQFELRLAAFPLGELIDSLAEGFSREAEERRVRLEVETAAAPELSTDPDRLRQIVANLVQNALFHTPPGGLVKLTASRDGGQAVITVTDSGSGIAPGQLPRVFDRFYRAGAGVRDAGLGLGLSISRELARAMGGDITAASKPGEGSSFTVTLPI